MSELKVLHICNWYPNILGPEETPFIRRHVLALEAHAKNTVWHIEVRHTTKGPRLERKSLFSDRTYLGFVPLKQHFFIEWCTTFLLVWAWLTRKRSQEFDLINIHIAYPLAMRTRFVQWMIGKPIVLTEQWSAYHYSFNSKSKGLERIRRIFHHGLPLICVSNALIKDIEEFSGFRQERAKVVDNVAETKHFHWVPGTQPVEGRFFAIAGWRFPKRPDVLIEMMALLRDKGIKTELRLAGNGPKMESMKESIQRLGLSEQIILLGHLSPELVAEEIRKSHALLHCSDYETYSAVCAESLCTGTPVIASNVGGISEYMRSETGSLVENNDAESWSQVVQNVWTRTLEADRQQISSYMTVRASTEQVGIRYSGLLKDVLRNASGTPKDAGNDPE